MNVKQSVRDQFSTAANAYAHSSVHMDGPDLQEMLAAAPRRPDGSPAAQALDIACGAGHTTLAFAEAGYRVHAVDLTQEMIDVARARAIERGVAEIHFRVGDAEDLPYPDDHFDIVTSRLAAHHYPNPEAAVREMARVTARGGCVLLSDVVAPEVPMQDTFLNTIELLRDRSHVRDHTLSQWHAMFVRAGLAPELVSTSRMFIDFDSWVARMQTPPPAVAQIRSLFEDAPADVREAFRLDAEGTRSFTLEIAVLRGAAPS